MLLVFGHCGGLFGARRRRRRTLIGSGGMGHSKKGMGGYREIL